MYTNSSYNLGSGQAIDLSDLIGMPIPALTGRHTFTIRVPGSEPSCWLGESDVDPTSVGFEIAPGDSETISLAGEHLWAIAESGTSHVKIFATVG